MTERPSATLRLRHPVPALPPFGSTDAGYSSDADDCASSCRESDERFVSAVQTANRRCVHKRGSVWSLSPVGLVDHSDPTTARQLRTVFNQLLTMGLMAGFCVARFYVEWKSGKRS